MLKSLKHLQGYKINATDGEIGQVHDFLFDDQHWTVRYFVIDTGNWLPGRKVILAPEAFGQPEWRMQNIPVNLTRKQVEESPDISTDEPVSRQKEIDVNKYFGWAAYWSNVGVAGTSAAGVPPEALRVTEKEARNALARDSDGDPHLRSLREVTDYHVSASDGTIGHIEDLIVDDQSWVTRYLVIDTRNILPGKKVLVSPDWVTKIDWAGREVHFDVTKEAIKNSPKFDPSLPINREYEVVLYDYYGRPQYWSA